MQYRHDTVRHTAKDLLKLDFALRGRAEDAELFQFITSNKEKKIEKFTNNEVGIRSCMRAVLAKFDEPRRVGETNDDIQLEGCSPDSYENISPHTASYIVKSL